MNVLNKLELYLLLGSHGLTRCYDPICIANCQDLPVNWLTFALLTNIRITIKLRN